MTASALSVPAARLLLPPLGRSPSTASSAPRKSPWRRCASPAKSASIPIATSRSRNCERRGRSAGVKPVVIYLPGEQRQPEPEAALSFDELTPREIVVELDKYIVGQAAAK